MLQENTGFLIMTTARAIINLLDDCQEAGEMVLVVGDPGTGKTTAAHWFVSEPVPGRFYLRVCPATGVALGVATGTVGSTTASSTMADWRAGMGLSQEQVVRLADATHYLPDKTKYRSNIMNATAADLSEVISRQGALGDTAGLAEIEVAALSSIFLSAGAAPEIAATAVKTSPGR